MKQKTTIDQFSGEVADAEQIFELKDPALWSIDTPLLYQAITEVSFDGKIVDQQTTTFGVRSIEFSAEKGLSSEWRKRSAERRLYAPRTMARWGRQPLTGLKNVALN